MIERIRLSNELKHDCALREAVKTINAAKSKLGGSMQVIFNEKTRQLKIQLVCE